MKILVINAGSSSLKYQVVDTATSKVITKGLCERIGIDGIHTNKTNGNKDIATLSKLSLIILLVAKFQQSNRLQILKL